MKLFPALCVSSLGTLALGSASGLAPPSPDRVVALLANGRLVVASASTGERLIDRALAEPARRIPGVGNYLAIDKARRTIYALVPASRDGQSGLLVKIDAVSGSSLWRRKLDRRTAFRSLVIGPRTGALYLFGNRLEATNDVIAVRVGGQNGALQRRWTFRRNAAGWAVFEGAVSTSETLLFASYHGPGRHGADWVSIDGRTRCSRRTRNACLRLHGGIEPLPGKLLATIGEPPLTVTMDIRGRVLARTDTQLRGNHLMQIALSRDRTKVFAIGSCGYSGGLSVQVLRTGTVRTFGYPAPLPRTPTALREGLCGDRIASGSRLIVIAKTHKPVPDAKADGAVVVVDHNGGTIRTIATSSEPVDVASLD